MWPTSNGSSKANSFQCGMYRDDEAGKTVVQWSSYSPANKYRREELHIHDKSITYSNLNDRTEKTYNLAYTNIEGKKTVMEPSFSASFSKKSSSSSSSSSPGKK